MEEIMHIMNIIKLIMKLYTFYRDIKFSLKAIMSNLHLVFSRRWAKSRRWNEDFVRVATYSILESEGCFIHPESSFTCALLLDGKRDSHDPSVAWVEVLSPSRTSGYARAPWWKSSLRGQHVGHDICETQAPCMFCPRIWGVASCHEEGFWGEATSCLGEQAIARAPMRRRASSVSSPREFR